MITSDQKIFRDLLISLIWLGCAIVAQADVLKLTSGRIIEGELTLLTEYDVTVETVKGQEMILYNMIKEVYPSENAPNSPLLSSLQLRFASKDGKRVQFYMAPWCPYCRKMEEIFVNSGIAYERLDIDSDAAARTRYDQLGQTGIPVVIVNGKQINGFDPESVKAAWDGWK